MLLYIYTIGWGGWRGMRSEAHLWFRALHFVMAQCSVTPRRTPCSSRGLCSTGDSSCCEQTAALLGSTLLLPPATAARFSALLALAGYSALLAACAALANEGRLEPTEGYAAPWI